MKDKIVGILGIIILIIILITSILLFKQVFNKYYRVPQYNKAICQFNSKNLEIKINNIKILGEEEYMVVDDQDNKWLLTSYYCTFVEE